MTTFNEMALPSELHKALTKLQFNNPTPIQTAVIPIATQGRDLIACAETGSGKTAAYGIPMLCRLLEKPESHALILAPTRELVQQIADFMRLLTSFAQGVQVVSIVGGADMRKQLNAMKRRPRIIVATPGRLIDHLKRRSIQLNTTEVLVLDEGDRMIDMGFAPQLEQILKFLPEQRQTSLFTATMTEKVRSLAQNYLTKPENITIGKASQPVSAIKQSAIALHAKEKNERIVDELNARQGSVIIFARTKSRANQLGKHLLSYGFAVDVIHGDRTQGQRNKAIQNFRQGISRILCATDIASRGIDVPQVQHVINFDLPMMDEDYVHRIGRTARNGATGEAISFVTPEDRRTWSVLVRKYRIQGADVHFSGKQLGGEGHPRNSTDDHRRPGRTEARQEKRTRSRDDRPWENKSRREEERPWAKKARRDEDRPYGKRPEKREDRPWAKKSRPDEGRQENRYEPKSERPFKKNFRKDEDRPWSKKTRRDEDRPYAKSNHRGDEGRSSGKRDFEQESERSFKKPFGKKKSFFGDAFKKFGKSKFRGNRQEARAEV